MFTKFSNSWELVKASWAVLRADKELIVFPIVSFFGVIAVTLVFLIPSLVAGVIDEESGISIAGYVVLFLYYVVMYTVIFFSNTALVGAALKRLDGGDPTLADGFNIAMSRIDKIIGYAVIASTVGIILNWIRERAGLLGSIAAGFLDLAWNVATFLVVPVLVVENVGPIEAVKRSTSLLKKTWGEQIVGNLGVGFVFGFIIMGVIIVIGFPLMALAIATGSAVVIIGAVVLIVLIVMALVLIQSTLNGIYVAAVYRYAVTGQVQAGFDPALIQGAFRQK